MANPVIDIRSTGRDSANLASVRLMADNMVHSWTSVTTGTIAVTHSTNTDVSFTQPADTIIRNLICIPAGNIVTAGSSGDDLDFVLQVVVSLLTKKLLWMMEVQPLLGLQMHLCTLFKTLMVTQLTSLLAHQQQQELLEGQQLQKLL